jgi:polyisoprenoid-binding protein YceI
LLSALAAFPFTLFAGALQIVTKPLTIQANLTGQRTGSKNEARTGADMHLIIKRSGFGVYYRSPALGDDVDLTVAVRK